MREMRSTFLALLLAAAPAFAAPPETDVKMLRVSGEGAGSASVVRLERDTKRGVVAVTVVDGARSRLFLKRSQTEPGTVVYEARLDARNGLGVTRRSQGPLLLEAGSFSLRVHEGDLGLRTVRCWIGSFASRIEPRLLAAAADVRVLRSWAKQDSLEDSFLPLRILWLADEETPAPRGEVKMEEGKFTGRPWDDLTRAALDALDRP